MRALVSQYSAFIGIRFLARLPRNRWGDCSLGEGSRDTIRGDRWFTMLLRSGCLWDVLIKSQITEQVSILNKWINKHSIFKPPREICKRKKGIFKEKDCVCHTAVWTHFSQIHFNYTAYSRKANSGSVYIFYNTKAIMNICLYESSSKQHNLHNSCVNYGKGHISY